LPAGSLRKRRKAATRERLLDSARRLFTTLGFEGATVRRIAQEAEMSVGAVFTHFGSKGEILSEVMQDRLEALYAELDGVATAPAGSTAARLQAMFATHFAFEAGHVKLFLAHIAAAFDPTLAPDAKPYGKNPRLREMVEACLVRGVADGDLDADLSVQDAVDLLMAAYAWTYRLAAWSQAGAPQMTAHMDRQILLIVSGLRARA
jgi:AcrR family transcriptional regulator